MVFPQSTYHRDILTDGSTNMPWLYPMKCSREQRRDVVFIMQDHMGTFGLRVGPATISTGNQQDESSMRKTIAPVEHLSVALHLTRLKPSANLIFDKQQPSMGSALQTQVYLFDLVAYNPFISWWQVIDCRNIPLETGCNYADKLAQENRPLAVAPIRVEKVTKEWRMKPYLVLVNAK